MAVVLRDDLQSGPAEAERDAGAAAGRALEQPSGGPDDSGTGPYVARPCRSHDRRRSHCPLPISFPKARRCRFCEKPSSIAVLVNFAAGRRSRFGGKGTPRRGSRWWASSPGDEEDLRGRPFVGPAGRVLDRRAGSGRAGPKQSLPDQRGEGISFRRTRQTADSPDTASRDIAVCRPWLQAEMEVVRPNVIVCLGASAAQSVLGEENFDQQRAWTSDFATSRAGCDHLPSVGSVARAGRGCAATAAASSGGRSRIGQADCGDGRLVEL